MNVLYLKEHVESLIEYMRSNGYSASYIKTCRSTSNHIIRLADDLSWTSYNDVRTWFSENGAFSDMYRENIKFAINVLEQFDETQTLPVHPVNPQVLTSVLHSIGELDLFPLQERMNEFIQELKNKGHQPEYIKSIRAAASKIIIMSRTVPWNTFQEIREYYQYLDKSDNTKRVFRLAISKMEAFLTSGKIPRHRNSPHCIEDARPSLGKLDLYELKERLPELQEYMEGNQYSKKYIKRTILTIERIIVHAGKVSWDSYQDVIDWYDSQDYGPGSPSDIHTVIRLMSAFHLYNIYPNNRAEQHPLWPRKNMYQDLIPEFKDIVDYGCSVQETRGLKKSSIDRARAEATAFFSVMQSKGITSIENISETAVLEFFHHGAVEKHRTKIPGLSLFMRDCSPLNSEEFHRIDSLLPIAHAVRKNVQYLKADESRAFRDALTDMDNDLSLKQRAVGTIFFYNGMRSSDVANLRLDSIDLKRQLISFTQVKTGVPVVLPLLPVVGNAIYDYCTLERPVSDSPFLFLGDLAPHNPLGSSALSWIVSKIMKLANIRQDQNDRQGTHIFRHRAATVMAENNVPAPVISSTLGHTSPKSLDAYLSADITHLRECAIDLGSYAMKEEVFDID